MDKGTLNIIMLVAMFAVAYFLILRPQQKKRKQLEEERANIQKGDKVITIGGIHGKVVTVNENDVIIAVEDGAKLRVEKTAVNIAGGTSETIQENT